MEIKNIKYDTILNIAHNFEQLCASSECEGNTSLKLKIPAILMFECYF